MDGRHLGLTKKELIQVALWNLLRKDKRDLYKVIERYYLERADFPNKP